MMHKNKIFRKKAKGAAPYAVNFYFDRRRTVGFFFLKIVGF